MKLNMKAISQPETVLVTKFSTNILLTKITRNYDVKIIQIIKMKNFRNFQFY